MGRTPCPDQFKYYNVGMVHPIRDMSWLSVDDRPSTGLVILWQKFTGRCYHCRIKTVLLPPKLAGDLAATRDHLIPRSRGGGGGKNIVLSCFRCNNDKNDKMPEEFVAERCEASLPQ